MERYLRREPTCVHAKQITHAVYFRHLASLSKLLDDADDCLEETEAEQAKWEGQELQTEKPSMYAESRDELASF